MTEITAPSRMEQLKTSAQANTLIGLSKGMAALGTLAALGSASAQTTLDTSELNTALTESLTAGRDAGKDLTCSAVMVFMDSLFMKFVFGGMMLLAVVMAFFAWYNQSRNGVTMGRVFWIIVIAMTVVALIGVITTTFMACA